MNVTRANKIKNNILISTALIVYPSNKYNSYCYVKTEERSMLSCAHITRRLQSVRMRESILTEKSCALRCYRRRAQSNEIRYFCLTTSPPFITKSTSVSSEISSNGLPLTATKSAYLPALTLPKSSCIRSNSAALEVAA